MKYITKLSLCLLNLFCIGCASAVPNLIDGKYYMAGDSGCTQGRKISDNRIMCVNSDGEDTGWRDAMTDQELQMYQHKQNLQAMQDQANAMNKPTTCYNIGTVTQCY